MSELKIPKSFDYLIDCKGNHVERFSNAIEFLKTSEKFDQYRNSKVVLLTHSTQITGDVFHLDDEDSEDDEFSFAFTSAKSIATATRNTFNEAIIEHEKTHTEKPISFSNVHKVIHLRNAVVMPLANPANKFNYHYLAVYTDQVVGLSFGEVEIEHR
ncbi:hypothetical protein M5X00_31595 [Paenibacillus alvei]|uniref:hypothetical protein n=1 Tax=Paenibacillus alvei TaxID=44250 RepID=UPI000288C374|nr:hypothetical protein [Paenibacillus alvei]EJW14776.1 hypothetical protein PAV_11c01170 [Paenibacillus alvei DSM 29]MCY9544969.1 hypothetical protein [Paenibacillus alvei]MCY9708603.1 hypothetical protein [Paenibacillus alvei]MCY9738340.1 hypothetical protein [Paenibacillus alvei]MCY9758767.1 hypothetical protein [Paenibacillus alvei]